ncbi:MAG: hypothetical protein LUC93_11720 [Planctomycetaceae bacterium]|nr:hypothetical protein [Planctomycetaceae bacterium]
MTTTGWMWSLRPDLHLVEAEPGGRGPSLLVHDPVPDTYDRVDWPESDLLRLLQRPLSIDEVMRGFMDMNPIAPTRAEIVDYMADLGQRGWLRGPAFWPERYREPAKRSWFSALAGLMFVQVPLFRPERFLKQTAGVVKAIFNPVVQMLLVAVGLAGLYLALNRWEDYWLDSLGGLDAKSLPAFLLAVVVVKAAHELGHAYQATLSGARVPVMGVALFFLMPLPFTDVTDAWRLPWSGRLRVATAGLRSELALAGVALFLWALSPPGAASATLARLSSVAFLSTLITNINPGPRFDGYFILSCLLRIENLRDRGAALLWGAVGRHGFGLPAQPVRVEKRGAVLVYAVYAFVYRLSLGAGLIAMAFHFLPKAMGLPVAALMAWLFFGRPVVGGVQALWRARGTMRITPAMGILALAVLGLGVWFFGAWPRKVSFPAVTTADHEEAVRLRRGGTLLWTAAARGDRVEQGQALAELGSEWLDYDRRQAESRLREAELAEARAWYGQATRAEGVPRAAETRRRQAELHSLRGAYDALSARAPIAGVIAAWQSDLAPGVALPRGELLGWITEGPARRLIGYAPADVAYRLEAGEGAVFFADDGSGPVHGAVTLIDRSRAEVLDSPHLAAALGAVADGQGGYVLPQPYARVEVLLDEPAARYGQTGNIWLRTRPESLASQTWNWFRALAVRESSF